MMPKLSRISTSYWVLFVSLVTLTLLSVFILRSIAPYVFPIQYVYLVLAVLIFYIFLKVDFEVVEIFSPYLYLISLVALILPLIIGQVTRGAIRWVQIGSFTIQPSEIVRPFLILYLSEYVTRKELDLKRFIRLMFLFFIPFVLILIQPSLGVAVLTSIGFLGVILASSIDKRYLLIGVLVVTVTLPGLWFILQPYQKERVLTFLDPASDPLGSGYNSIQSMVSVGSGRLFGRGLGEGIQTQLQFLPEKQTDFVFAAISEELGFLGSILVLFGFFALLSVIIHIVGNAINPAARAYAAGVFLVMFAQILVHIGMNMGLLPITGVPLPFVSAGGSSLLGATISLALVIKAKKD